MIHQALTCTSVAVPSLRSVRVTLWHQTAEGLDALLQREAGGDEHPVVVVTRCRISDYGGVSLSCIGRSQVVVSPDLPEARHLREWYLAEGLGKAPVPLGEGLTPSSGSARPSSSRTLAELADLPVAPDNPPVWSSLVCTLATLPPDQQLYYKAHPESSKKVVDKEGRYYCEQDGTWCDAPAYRYVFMVRMADHTGEAPMQAFNEQGAKILGTPAEQVARLKEGAAGPSPELEALLRRAQWQDFAIRVVSKAREFNNETRMRHTISSIENVNYSQENSRLLGLLKGMVPAEAAA